MVDEPNNWVFTVREQGGPRKCAVTLVWDANATDWLRAFITTMVWLSFDVETVCDAMRGYINEYQGKEE